MNWLRRMFAPPPPTDEEELARHRQTHRRVLGRSEQAIAAAFRKADEAIRKLPERRHAPR